MPRGKLVAIVLAGLLPACTGSTHAPRASHKPPASNESTTSKPPSTNPVAATNVYAQAGPDMLSPVVRNDLKRVYVPNSLSGTVSVIDPQTFQVIDTFVTGGLPEHVVPSYDLRTLWVNNMQGSLTGIDPATGRPTRTISVDAPYNLYFTPGGSQAIVVNENQRRLDFRDPQTMALRSSMHVPCPGVNHLDYSADLSFFVASCETGSAVMKFDIRHRTVAGVLHLPRRGAKPQDVRLSPDGRIFYVADMVLGGVWLIDAITFKIRMFLPAGVGTHGIFPSRDGSVVYLINRGSRVSTIKGPAHGKGSIAVLDPTSNRIVARWPLPGGGSPDMGNVTADGSRLWLAGRYDREVYCFDTKTGKLLARIPVGQGPHGLTVWPQPGRFSLGHTGNMR